jgi:hypothetical protein
VTLAVSAVHRSKRFLSTERNSSSDRTGDNVALFSRWPNQHAKFGEPSPDHPLSVANYCVKLWLVLGGCFSNMVVCCSARLLRGIDPLLKDIGCFERNYPSG